MIRRTVSTFALSIAALASVALPARAQDVTDPDAVSAVDQAARRDLMGPATGIGAAVMYEGEMDLLAAWGKPGPEAADELNPQFLFPFRALGEVMLAATVRALDDAEQIDVDRALGTLLPDLPAILQPVTLNQLLSHTAGLDDAAPGPGLGWDNVLEELPASARFAPPGAVYSRSRYSYPVAARVLERLLGASFEEIIQFAIIGPLGMSRTSFDPEFARIAVVMTPADGSDDAPAVALPVVYTTPADVVQFVAAWMAEAIRGTTPGAFATDTPVGRVWSDGMEILEYVGLTRAALSSSSDGVHARLEVYPESATALLFWGNGGPVTAVRERIEQDIYFALDILGLDPAPRPEGAELDASWVGTYLNGDQMLELREGPNGEITLFDGTAQRTLVADERNVYTATRGGEILSFRPVLAGSQRILYVGERAYLRR